MNTKRYSLVLRIALSFALLLIFAMGLLGIYLTDYFQETYLNILQTNLLSETRLAADRISLLFAENPVANEINESAEYYAELLNVRVTIIDRVGEVLGESHTTAGEMENHLDRPEIQRALAGETSAAVRYSDTLQTEMLYAASPIRVNGEITGVTRLAVSLRSVQRTGNQILGSVLIAIALATAGSILVNFLIANYTVHPLRKLTGSVQRMAGGSLEEITAAPQKDEISQLQKAFQYMAHQLQEQIDELRNERTKLEVVLQNISDGILMVSDEGVVQLINPAALRLFEKTEDEAVGHSLIEVTRSHQLVDLWRSSVNSGKQQATTLESIPERLFIQAIASPLDQSLPGMSLLLVQDLTRVRRLETVRRDFVSNVSHELRTPLASLKALTETLQEGALEDPPAARRFLDRMDVEIDNLSQMVHELLELSRIESNKVPMRLISIHPCDLTAPAVERMQVQAEKAGLKLTLRCPDDLPEVRADPSRIEHILVNLIHNAIKFTPPGGEIIVSAYRDGSNVVFFVRDSGAGIAQEELPRIFERFYKTDRSRSGGGTGLGLSIARHVVEAHRGKIWAESVLRQGSTFYFSLPVA